MQNASGPSQNGLDFHDVLYAIRRDRKLIAAIIVTCLGVFIASTAIIPRKYKSSAELGIYSEYFQNPLIKDFLPETYESNELRSQREALVRSTFDPDFLDQLGEKYGLFKSDRASTKRIIERQEFAKNIEAYLIQGSTVLVAFTGPNPQKVFGIVTDIVDRAKAVLSDGRRKMVETLRDSIQQRLESMAMSDGSAPDPAAASRPRVLKRELERIEAQISSLSEQFTPQHPAVRRLEERAALLRTWLKHDHSASSLADSPADSIKESAPPKNHSNNPALLGGESREVNKQVYEDLIRKLSYLNIVLEMDKTAENSYVSVIEAPSLPTSPIYPKPAVFALWGLLVGGLLAMFTVLLREYFERTSLSVEDFSKRIGVIYLGSAPALKWEVHTAGGPTLPTGSLNPSSKNDEWH